MEGYLSKLAFSAISLALFLVMFQACADGGRGPVPAGAPTGYCPVCGMKVRAADQYTSQIVYRDGTKLMFESQSDMLQLYFGPDLPERPTYGVPATHLDRSNIERLAVKDYTTGREIDGREAVLVYGSRVDGPMGPDVFAFTRREDAETFSGTNGGRVMTFAELTPQMVLELVKN